MTEKDNVTIAFTIQDRLREWSRKTQESASVFREYANVFREFCGRPDFQAIADSFTSSANDMAQAADRIDESEAELKEMLMGRISDFGEYQSAHERVAELDQLLGNVLAVLNGDGGHRQSEVGQKQAAEEGIARFHELLEIVDRLPKTEDGVRLANDMVVWWIDDDDKDTKPQLVFGKVCSWDENYVRVEYGHNGGGWAWRRHSGFRLPHFADCWFHEANARKALTKMKEDK
jgi:hypothetical protein